MTLITYTLGKFRCQIKIETAFNIFSVGLASQTYRDHSEDVGQVIGYQRRQESDFVQVPSSFEKLKPQTQYIMD